MSVADNKLGRGAGGGVLTVAVAGNPNVGKSTSINAIAGTRLQVGNWPGVTVEKKEALFDLDGMSIRLVDLPGTYSLSLYPGGDHRPISLVHEKPDLIVNVVDATNLERNLYLTVQLLGTGYSAGHGAEHVRRGGIQGYRIDSEGIERMLWG